MQATGHSYNKIVKKSNQCRDGWMEALADDKVQNTIYNTATLISHNRPYISSSNKVPTIVSLLLT